MYKIIILIFSSIFLFSCNKHSNVIQLKPKDNNNFVYQEKPFELKWKIEKKSITNIPIEVQKKLKIFAKNIIGLFYLK